MQISEIAGSIEKKDCRVCKIIWKLELYRLFVGSIEKKFCPRAQKQQNNLLFTMIKGSIQEKFCLMP